MRKPRKRGSTRNPIKQGKSNEFTFDIWQRKQKLVKVKGKRKKVRKYFYQRIKESKFIPNRYYRIFIRHKPSNTRRLLGFGKFVDIPVFHRGRANLVLSSRDRKGEKHKVLITRPIGGREFKGGKIPKRAIRGWYPINQQIKHIEDEVFSVAEAENLPVKSIIIPPKKYFHPEYHFYSDKPMKGTKKIYGVGIHILVAFNYGTYNESWVGKQVIPADLRPRGIQVRHFYSKYRARWEVQASAYLQGKHQKADVKVIRINGFVELDWLPKESGTEVSALGHKAKGKRRKQK